METKHTAEPWHVGGTDKSTIYDEFGLRIANSFEGVMVSQRSDATCSANARRIVACVNACAGIRTEALETRVHLLQAEDSTVKMLEKQRDELLAACKGLLRAHRITIAHPPKTVEQAEQQLDAIRNAVTVADAAIAKAEGSPT